MKKYCSECGESFFAVSHEGDRKICDKCSLNNYKKWNCHTCDAIDIDEFDDIFCKKENQWVEEMIDCPKIW